MEDQEQYVKLPKSCGALYCRNESNRGRVWFVDAVINGLPVRAMVVLCEEHGMKASPDRDLCPEDFLKTTPEQLQKWADCIAAAQAMR